MQTRHWLAVLLLIASAAQYGCAAVAGGAIGAAIGHEAAEEDDDE
ncbi:MAG TPA: hypothetical protein VIN61_11320 [Gammaproteobacteria bacterium]